MGDPYKKKQVENAKKRRELAKQEASAPKLPSQPILRNVKLSLVPIVGTKYVPGERLAVMADETAVRVVRNGYQDIGLIEGESAQQLREAFVTEGGTNVIEVHVTDVANISGIAYAEVIQR